MPLPPVPLSTPSVVPLRPSKKLHLVSYSDCGASAAAAQCKGDTGLASASLLEHFQAQFSAHRVKSAHFLLCSGPVWDLEGTQLGPRSTGSVHRCSHFGTVLRTVLCPIDAVPRPTERFERAGWTSAARQVPMGRPLTSVWHFCGPGSHLGPVRVPPGSRPGPARVPSSPARVPPGSRPGPNRVLSDCVCSGFSTHL